MRQYESATARCVSPAPASIPLWLHPTLNSLSRTCLSCHDVHPRGAVADRPAFPDILGASASGAQSTVPRRVGLLRPGPSSNRKLKIPTEPDYRRTSRAATCAAMPAAAVSVPPPSYPLLQPPKRSDAYAMKAWTLPCARAWPTAVGPAVRRFFRPVPSQGPSASMHRSRFQIARSSYWTRSEATHHSVAGLSRNSTPHDDLPVLHLIQTGREPPHMFIL
ncbi:hypothetical protein AcV7_008483 [Taiwanofungus camphoratus]|nr:hypothetical protein AcV7_008483 [Antrodia cinnamomea]